MPLKIMYLVTLLFLSAMFSASETALTTLTPAKVVSLEKKKTSGFGFVKKIKSNPHRLLATILIGNNLVNIAASVYAGALFTELFDSKGLGIATGVMTICILIFGEITPKTFASRYSEKFSLVVAPVIYVMEFLLYPFLLLFEHFIKSSIKIFGGKKSIQSVTEDEIRAMAIIGVEEGAIKKQEREFIENVLEFNDIEVEDIMTPRTEIEALSDKTTVKEAAQKILEFSHTRIPIYHNTLDKMVAMITVKDIFHHHSSTQLDTPLSMIKNLQKPHFVPTSKKINALFHEFNKKRMHLAVVVDEHGGTEGIVTMEDILEEIVGEIVDESDREESLITVIDRNTLLMKGKTPIYEIAEAFNLNFENIEDEYQSVSSLILDILHRFPRQGEEIPFENVAMKVEEMENNKIIKVKVTRLTKVKK